MPKKALDYIKHELDTAQGCVERAGEYAKSAGDKSGAKACERAEKELQKLRAEFNHKGA